MNCSDRQHERGAELVEMALIMPLFLALVIGVLKLEMVITSMRMSHTQPGKGSGRLWQIVSPGGIARQEVLIASRIPRSDPKFVHTWSQSTLMLPATVTSSLTEIHPW